MKLLLLLGKGDEYLCYRKFETEEESHNFLESIKNLIILNIQGDLPLRKRLLQLPKDENGKEIYFPMAGAVQGFEYIDLDEKEETYES